MKNVPRPPPDLADDAHKGDAGRVLVLAGSAGDGSTVMPGAAVLTTHATLRSGAGLVTALCLDPRVWSVLAHRVPEALLVEVEGGRGAVDRVAFEIERRADDRVRAIGPGLGPGPHVRPLVESFLVASRAALVVDADGLNAFAGRPEDLRRREGALVLTPHPGEAARLLGRHVSGDEPARRAAARELAERTGGVCVLKGHRTVVDDGRRTWICETGNPGLARGGSGDVLTGVVAGHLAAVDADFDAFDAACSAVWVHGRAADLATVESSRRALLASDVCAALGRAQRDIGCR